MAKVTREEAIQYTVVLTSDEMSRLAALLVETADFESEQWAYDIWDAWRGDGVAYTAVPPDDIKSDYFTFREDD